MDSRIHIRRKVVQVQHLLRSHKVKEDRKVVIERGRVRRKAEAILIFAGG
jgi:hypothetical protein